MASIDEQILRTAKEIIVKFIETGRVSPAGFSEAFQSIHATVNTTVKEALEGTGTSAAEAGVPQDPARKGRKQKAADK